MRFGRHLACTMTALLPLGLLSPPKRSVNTRAVDTLSIEGVEASVPPQSIGIPQTENALERFVLRIQGGSSNQSGQAGPPSGQASGKPPAGNSSGNSTESAQQHWERGQTLANAGDLDDAIVELRRAATLAPNNARYLSSLGAVLAQRGNFEEAVRYFERAHKVDPANAAVLQNLAAAQWQLGKLRDAETNLRQTLRLNPGNREATLLLGMVLENRGEYAPAAKMLSSVPELVKTHPESLAALLHCYYETSRLEDAYRLEDEVVVARNDVQAAFLCATVAVRQRDFDAAEKILATNPAGYPNEAAVDYQLALTRYGKQEYAEAEQLVQQLIERDGEDGKYFNLLGWCLAKEGKATDSVKAFDRAIDLDPREDSNYVDLATVLMDTGSLPAALEVAEKAVSVDPNSYEAQRIAGQIQTRQHNYEAALRSYTRAAQLNRDNSDAMLDLALAQDAAGRRDDARATLDGAIRKFPREAQLYYHDALLLLYPADLDDHTKETKAIGLLRKALAIDDAIAGAHYELGNILLSQSQSSKALSELQAAEKLAPSDSNTHYALWSAYRKLGQTQQGENELQIFQKLKSQEGAGPQ